jgi:GDPmannose 4,6-dehydratase
LSDLAAVSAALDRIRPDLAFHVAAVHGSAGFSYESRYADLLAVNIGSLQAVLEHARRRGVGLPVIYASSAKVFGDPLPEVISETSPRLAHCIYSISKIAAESIIDYYNTRHGLRGSVLYLFNHESEFRPGEFFIPKIVATLASALDGETEKVDFQRLDFFCDWGSAEEYMDIAVDVAEKAAGEHFIVATGHIWNARHMVDALFARHGLDYRQHIAAPEASGMAGAPYRAVLDKMERQLGRAPRTSILDVCDRMLTMRRRMA